MKFVLQVCLVMSFGKEDCEPPIYKQGAELNLLKIIHTLNEKKSPLQFTDMTQMLSQVVPG